MRCNRSSSKREVYSSTMLPQKARKILNRQPNFTPKRLEKEEQQQQKLEEGKKS